jgi:hypothetical protein
VIYAATITLISLVLLAVSVWQFVGIWRSAGKHRARGGRRFWAWAARFAVFTGFLGFAWTLSQQDLPKLKEFWCIAAGDPCIGTHALHVLRGGTELELAGGITFGLTKEVTKLLEVNPKIQVIRLKGPGGRIGEAHELRRLIGERGLVTYVGSTCASACTIAFLGGSRRYLAPGARLGFHRGTFPGATIGELDRENNADRRWLIGMGVPRWFADRAYSTPNDDIWWPTPHELWQAGVITDITGGPAALAFHGLTAAATQGDIDEELQKTSLYVAIKRAEPDTYHRILVACSSG